jgi:hypothetical protein
MEVRQGCGLKYQNNIQTTEMRFLRQVTGYIILDLKLNINIRRELEMFDFIG